MEQLPNTVPVIIANRSSAYVHGSHFESTTEQPSVNFGKVSRSSPLDGTSFLNEYAQHLKDSACRIAATRPTYLLRPIPEMPAYVSRMLARAALLGRPIEMVWPLKTYHRRHALVWSAQDEAQKQCQVHILDPLPILCTDESCAAIDGDKPRYYDNNHLSGEGNKLLVPMFQKVFEGTRYLK